MASHGAGRRAAAKASEGPSVDVQELERAALLLFDCQRRLLLRHYRSCNRDLTQALVLLQIVRESTARSPVRAVTAWSVGVATGIPRETVRRKVAALVSRGLVRVDDRARLSVTARALRQLCESTREPLAELRAVERALTALTRSRTVPDPPHGSRQR